MKPQKNQKTVAVPTKTLRAILKQVEAMEVRLDRLGRRIGTSRPAGGH